MHLYHLFYILDQPYVNGVIIEILLSDLRNQEIDW